MFSGSYSVAIDEKGRIAFPAGFRQELAQGAGLQLTVTQGADPCLEIYPMPVFNAKADKISTMTDYTQKRLLTLAWVGRSVKVEIDKQGRLSLPQKLREAAGLVGSALVVGLTTHFEIWPEERWNAMWNAEGPGSRLPELSAALQAINL